MMGGYDTEQIAQEISAVEVKNEDFQQFVDMMIARKTHLSFSSMRKFMGITGGSPYDFMLYKLRKKTATKAMDLGRVIDVLLLTPDEIDQFVIAPEGAALNSLAGIDIYAKWIAKLMPEFDPALLKGLKMDPQKVIIVDWLNKLSEVKTIISAADFKLATYITNRVLRNDNVNDIIRFRKAESAQANVEFNQWGWDWKGKTDLTLDYGGYKYKNGCVIDCKLTVDASHQAALRTIRFEHYSAQGAIYTIGQGLDVPFLNIFYDRVGGVSIIEHSKRALENSWNDLEHYTKQLNTLVLASEIMPGKWFDSHTYWGDSNGILYMQ